MIMYFAILLLLIAMFLASMETIGEEKYVKFH